MTGVVCKGESFFRSEFQNFTIQKKSNIFKVSPSLSLEIVLESLANSLGNTLTNKKLLLHILCYCLTYIITVSNNNYLDSYCLSLIVSTFGHLDNYTNSYYSFPIVELLTVNSNF